MHEDSKFVKKRSQGVDVRKDVCEQVVFKSTKPEPTEHPVEFVPMEYMARDDELVYVPELSFSDVSGRKPLSFEGYLKGVYGMFMLESGASHSYMSLDLAQEHCMRMEQVQQQFTK